MLAHSDPATFVALLLLVLLALTLWRLQWTRRRRIDGRRRLAVATGHPSTLGAVSTVELASEAADQLAAMGLISERTGGRVWVRGLAGEYVLTVIRRGLHVTYRSSTEPRAADHELDLGYFPSVDRGVREVARHADLRAVGLT